MTNISSLYFVLRPKVRFWLLFASLSLAAFSQSTPTPLYRWTTFAGRASMGSEDGPAANARFNQPHGLVYDATGNVYVADTGNHTIRKITPAGVVSTYAGTIGVTGSADGAGTAVRFNSPQGVAIDPNGNLYVADTGNHTIRKITPAGVVTTLAGQAGKSGNADGAAALALFNQPDQIAVDAGGNVYVADRGIRKISSGMVETLVLSTPLKSGGDINLLATPSGSLAVDPSGRIYFSAIAAPTDSSVPYQFSQWRVMVRETSGTIAVLLSQDFADPQPHLNSNMRKMGPMTLDDAGNLFYVPFSDYVGDNEKYALRRADTKDGSPIYDLPNNAVYIFESGNGAPDQPHGLAYNPSAGSVIFTRTSDDAIIQRTPTRLTVLAGTARPGATIADPVPSARFADITTISLDKTGNILAGDAYSRRWYDTNYLGRADLWQITSAGIIGKLFSTAETSRPTTVPTDVTADNAGNIYFTTEDYFSNLTRISAALTSAPIEKGDFSFVVDTATDALGNLLVVDREHRLHQRTTAGAWSVLAGNSGPAKILDGARDVVSFGDLLALKISRTGDIYVLDSTPSTPGGSDIAVTVIRKVQSNGTVTTVSKNLVKTASAPGQPSDYPSGFSINRLGDFLLVYTGTHKVTRLNANGDEVVIGGQSGLAGNVDGDSNIARFDFPHGLVTDEQDNVYLVDGIGTTIRKGEFLGYAPTITTQPQSQTVALGTAAQFSVTVSGTPAPTYQWLLNGAVLSGMTSSSLSLASVRNIDAGDYTVVVTNPLGSVTSSKATLTVSAAPAPTPTPTPTPSGGGGSIEGWFALGLVGMAVLRRLR